MGEAVCPECGGALILRLYERKAYEMEVTKEGGLYRMDEDVMESSAEVSCESGCDLTDRQFDYNGTEGWFEWLEDEELEEEEG